MTTAPAGLRRRVIRRWSRSGDRLEARGTRVKLTKHLFVTGGVASSLGKGLTASSLGNLLVARDCGSRCRSWTRTSMSIRAP